MYSYEEDVSCHLGFSLTMSQANFDSSLKSVFVVYRFYGLDLFEYGEEEPSTLVKRVKSRCFRSLGIGHCILTTFGILVLLLGMLLTGLIIAKKGYDGFYLLSYMASMSLMSIEVLAYEITIVKTHDKIRAFYRSLTELGYVLRDEHFIHFKKWAIAICVSPLIVVAIVGSCLTLAIMHDFPDIVQVFNVENLDMNADYSEDSDYYLNETENSTWMSDLMNEASSSLIMWFITWLSYYYSIVIMTINVFYLIHLKGFILLFCFIVKRLFKTLPDFCYKRAPEADHHIKSRYLVMELHRKMCQLVAMADHVYSETTFISFGIEISTVVFILRAFNFGFKLDDDINNNSPLEILSYIIPFGLAIVLLVCRTLVLAYVNQMIRSSMKYLFIHADGEQKVSFKMFSEMAKYVSHCELSLSLLTGWRCFDIVPSCLLAAFGYILTYTLMLYGIQ